MLGNVVQVAFGESTYFRFGHLFQSWDNGGDRYAKVQYVGEKRKMLTRFGLASSCLRCLGRQT